jgi:hypothetical protein
MRTSIFSFALFLVSSCLYAQSDDQKWSMGLQTSCGISRFKYQTKNSQFFSFSPRQSFGFLGYAERQIGKKGSVSIEPGISIKGANVNESSFISNYSVIFTYAHLGVLVGLRLNQKWHISTGSEVAVLIKKDDFFFQPNKYDAGIIAQVKYQANNSLGFGLKLNQGFTDFAQFFYTDQFGAAIERQKYYNQSAHLFVRFRLS